ncbi:MAG TPA: sodium:proton antiporter [Planctomycetota bacterium]|jgi:Na+/H+ antiporter NhaD/arsenite permease-like protein|nr:sodium:proton antiporter [Planctomycetota bacterium]
MASSLGTDSGGGLPLWTVLPFACYLLTIAVVPLFFGHYWKRNRNKLILALAASAPVIAYLLSAHAGHLLLGSVKEYIAFIVLLASLFIISGDIHLKGTLTGTPLVNTGFLALGAVLASLIGTTGASMLLIRPLLRANEKRDRKTHIVIFFIFIVSNGGGMLTPLGDPPLFLGFLRGVPFLWTLQLFAPWALVNGVLLVIFIFLDQAILKKEVKQRPVPRPEEVQGLEGPLRILGGLNFLWLLGVIAVNAGVGYYGSIHHWSDGLEKMILVAGTGAMAGLSRLATPEDIRTVNGFTWGPLVEVAVIFIGVFVTMVPATLILEEMGRSGAIRMNQAWQFFWGSGVLSSFLDNAPSYVTSASLACGVVGGQTHQTIDPANLGQLLAQPHGALFLKAVSCGSVFMGANSYIGNGPNFMVKAIAEERQVPMPSFLGYMGWSIGILIPLFIVVTLIFFR